MAKQAGLRTPHFALAAVLHTFAYLRQALAVLLIFIGSKPFAADMFGFEKFPAAWPPTLNNSPKGSS